MKISNTLPRVYSSFRRFSFLVLVEHFFGRFFAGEAFSGDGDLRIGIGGILALLPLPGAILPLFLLPKYSSFFRWMAGVRHFDYNTASIPDKYTFVAITMAITGIVAVLKWDSLFPDRLDYANLTPLPIPLRRIFFAKFSALLLFAALFILALNAASTFLFPYVVMGNQTGVGVWLRFTVAHLAATVTGSAFMFFAFLALAGFVMILTPQRLFTKISVVVQCICVILLILLLFATPVIESRITSATTGVHGSLRYLPTAWFLGIYQSLSSPKASSGFHSLAVHGYAALAIAACMSVVLYIASYRRFFRRIPETEQTSRSKTGKWKERAAFHLGRLLPQAPFERACFRFAAKTLLRSRRHMLLLAVFAGLGAAISIQDVAIAWSQSAQGNARLPSATLLSAAPTLIFFVLTGLFLTFSVPAELHANWVFESVAKNDCLAVRHAARKLMLILVAPVLVCTAAFYSAFGGVRLGFEHTAFVLVISLWLIETLLVNYRKIPFTCSYSAAKHNIGIVLAIYFLAFLFFSVGLTDIERMALSSHRMIGFLMLLGLVIAISLGSCHYGRKSVSSQGSLLFADESEPVVPSMNLR